MPQTPTPNVIDLFHGDTVTSFPNLKSAGILGVIHKSTEGSSYVDPTYPSRRTQARASGLLWGAYHFMRPGDPVTQAQFFLKSCAADENTLLALDHEDDSVPLSDAIAFMQEVERQTEFQCVLYSGSLLKEQIGKATAAQKQYLYSRRLWLPEYGDNPVLPQGYADNGRGTYWLWQFTGDGVGPEPHTLPGVSGNIDINSYSGTPDQLASEWAGSPLSSPASPAVAAASPKPITISAASVQSQLTPAQQEHVMSFLDSIVTDLQNLQKILPIVSPRLAQIDHVLVGAIEHLGKFIDAGQTPQAAASSVTSLTDAAVNAAQTVQASTGASAPAAVAAVTDHLDPTQPNEDSLTPDDPDSANGAQTGSANASQNPAGAGAQQSGQMALTSNQ